MRTDVTTPSAAAGTPPALRRRFFLGALALLAGTLLVAGCGEPPDQDAPTGTTVTQDGVAYSVQSSRELNPLEPDDRALLAGLAQRKGLTGPDTTLVGSPSAARQRSGACGRRRRVPGTRPVRRHDARLPRSA